MKQRACVWVACWLLLGLVCATTIPVGRLRPSQNLQSQKAKSTPLAGGVHLGIYYLNLTVGQPPQPFTVQLDTGSADLALPSTTCPTSSCGEHSDAYYDPSQSITSTSIDCTHSTLTCPQCSHQQCGYTIRYLDKSSFQAFMYNDTLQVGDYRIWQDIGGITSENSADGFEPYEVDGILGVAYSACSKVHAPTLIDNLVTQAGLDNVFALCMTAEGGQLYLGEHPQPSQGVIQYTPIVDEFYYNVLVTDILLHGRSIGVPQYIYNTGGASVDSGTSDLILPEEAYHTLADAVFQLCSSGTHLVGTCSEPPESRLFDARCIEMTESEVKDYPVITIVLNGGVYVPIQPEDWIVTGYCEDPALYAIAIDPIPATYGTILGDTFMRGRVTIFDRQNSRLGFFSTNTCE